MVETNCNWFQIFATIHVKIMAWHVQNPKSPGACLKLVVFRIEEFLSGVPAPHFFITKNHIPSEELVKVPTGRILRIIRISVTGAEDQSVYS